MRIGYDLHGVLTAAPDFYRRELESRVDGGHEVAIISGSPAITLYNELEALKLHLKIHYTELHSVVGHLLGKGHPHTIDERGYWFNERLWWQAKAEICRDHHIDVLFDNEERYGKHFKPGHPTQFILTKPL